MEGNANSGAVNQTLAASLMGTQRASGENRI
jgi:hypothetical protein